MLGWYKLPNSCIWIASQNKTAHLTHNEAMSHCQQMIPGGRLFEPKNEASNDLVSNLVSVHDGGYVAGLIFIGINDKDNEGQFVYDSSNEPISFSNWRAGDPDGGTGSNCVGFQYRESTKTKWIDATCSNKFRFLCEKSLN